MKRHALLALVGLVIGFALPTFAQQTNTPDPQLRQKLVDVIAKHAEAMNKNDAAAAAALFTEDAVYVTDKGPVNGRLAIEKMYTDLFQNVHFSNHLITVDPDCPHLIGREGNQMWATGGWSSTIQGQNFGPVEIKGYWSVIREGEDWKIRMLTPVVTPAPSAPSAATPSPRAATPSNQ
ncbi:MAG TPA: SgcJ/EcaC family oxidoreductase [Chthoniobacterales bacterium]